MKSFSTAEKAAMEAGTAKVGGAVQILCDDPVRVWSGEGTLPIAGDGYTGIGARGMAQVTGGAIGSAAQGITLSLSGIEPAAIALLDAPGLKNAPVTIWRLIFDGTGTQFLGAHVFRRGRVDTVASNEVVGGEAAIHVAVEGSARGLSRRGGRMRTDADQRLIDSTDGGFRRVSYAGKKMLYWAGRKPAMASSALPSGGGASNRINEPRTQER
ncbi:hypothetical protein [Sphingobium lignivorans]|uniref:Uncharacterized protein n=1 Tax=Sphingobium lignivorans TaxID=2735886 RepID=A0ABR6NJI0_9SPHN|nr:hypothetical protein [Sphingobium lignivorans]MBB5987438.1 hypothetical protein [Sphingobium lignivorans]